MTTTGHRDAVSGGGRTRAERIEEFTRDGFTLLPGALTPAEVRRVRVGLERVVDKVRAAPGRFDARYTRRDADGTDTWGVNHLFTPGLYEDAVAAVFDNHALLNFVHAVLGERVRFWTAHALWSPRQVDYELNWHKDNGEHEFHTPSGEPTHLQFNVCLTADDSFHVVPGSHRRPLTDRERAQIEARGTGALPGEAVVRCRPGDVLFMNHHTVHRGSCPVSRFRRTLHMNLQAADEPTGGHTSWRFMREEGYLDQVHPVLRAMMRNTVAWDDAHPLTRAEARRRLRASRDIKRHVADGPPDDGPVSSPGTAPASS